MSAIWRSRPETSALSAATSERDTLRSSRTRASSPSSASTRPSPLDRWHGLARFRQGRPQPSPHLLRP